MEPPSPFFNAGSVAQASSLAILQLRRDSQIPLILAEPSGSASDNVLNTRFGAYPHDTLVGQAWGSQILASKVNSGSRGRPGKRKRGEDDDGEDLRNDNGAPQPVVVAAGTGFAHLLQPTPESWTMGLPHRTQVVYTPDYSFILQKLRVRPGSRLMEAGAGSGSFTHAAARAVFDGTPKGRVFSFEYHEPRAQSLRAELINHRLTDVVTVTHRDVYEQGFLLDEPSNTSPKAHAIFLDLPAPWLALRKLTRRRLPPSLYKAVTQAQTSRGSDLVHSAEKDTGVTESVVDESIDDFISPLDPLAPIHVCTFTPCIEQVQSTVSALRQLGWTQIQMFEIQNRRLDVRRERIGLAEEGLRGSTAAPKDAEEAIERLLAVEGKFKAWEASIKHQNLASEAAFATENPSEAVNKGKSQHKTQKQQRQERNREVVKERKLYKEGVLVHKTENEVKTHTSYLTFAVLPVEWTDEDEANAMKKWGSGSEAVRNLKNSGSAVKDSAPSLAPE